MRIFEQWSTRKCFVLFSIYYTKDFAAVCIFNFLLEWPRTDMGRRIHAGL